MKILKVNRFLLINYLILILYASQLSGCKNIEEKAEVTDITIENAEMKLILGNDGTAKSLIHKSSREECLMVGTKIPVFTITQDRPYDNEIMLAYPAKSKTFASDSIYRIGDDLIISFELTDYEATVGVKITDDYIGFTLNKLEYKMADFGVKRKTRVDEFTLLQLPIKNRTHFGEWLNVLWDEKVAVNLLATDPFAKIDAKDRQGYKIFQAGGIAEVKVEGVGAALITTEKSKLLDRIDRVERDFGLPLGVESRRSKEYKNSYYELRDVTTQNIDEHIAFAKLGGFKQMVVYWMDFATSMGHFPWKTEYPNGMEDLKEITQKIKAAGMIPGFHIHYNKASRDDSYVSPIPDSRLNQRQVFTVNKDLSKEQTTINVTENPSGVTLEEGRRILKNGTELIVYESYTVKEPYQFIGCRRGGLNTGPLAKKNGEMIGLLDVDTWPKFVRFNQKTNIQEEVSERLGEIYKQAGFQFIYFDGSEDAPPPYWFNISWSKLITYNAFKPAPIFSEGAVKSHFCWHIQSRGNAFDLFPPEVVKEATRKHPAAEAKFLSNDFTALNFGWNDYLAPDENTVGMQPDMFAYICSRGAAWDCPIALMGKLDQLRAHPRTNDNLEVIRRWEEIRTTNFLTQKQKDNLKNLDQEHMILINERGDFELLPYSQIKNISNGSNEARAFIFNRNNKPWVVYWHTSGEGILELPVNSKKINLFEKPGKEISFQTGDKKTAIPLGPRRYIQFDLSYNEVINLFAKAKIR